MAVFTVEHGPESSLMKETNQVLTLQGGGEREREEMKKHSVPLMLSRSSRERRTESPGSLLDLQLISRRAESFPQARSPSDDHREKKCFRSR